MSCQICLGAISSTALRTCISVLTALAICGLTRVSTCSSAAEDRQSVCPVLLHHEWAEGWTQQQPRLKSNGDTESCVRVAHNAARILEGTSADIYWGQVGSEVPGTQHRATEQFHHEALKSHIQEEASFRKKSSCNSTRTGMKLCYHNHGQLLTADEVQS
jgi:hypothetical protein